MTVPQYKRIKQLLALEGKVTSHQVEMVLNENPDNSVKIRAVQRYLAQLADWGECQKEVVGKATYWVATPEAQMKYPTATNATELLALHVMKAQLEHFRGTTLEQVSSTLLEELEKQYPGRAFRNSPYTHLGFGNFDYSAYTNVIDTLIHAIVERRSLTLHYQSRSGNTSKKQGFPLGMYEHNGGLYIALFAPQNGTRPLRVEGIERLESNAQTGVVVPAHELDRFMKSRFGITSGQDATLEQVVLRVVQGKESYITNRKWHWSQKLVQDQSGQSRLYLNVPINQELCGWILSWAGVLVVESPESLRTQLKKNIGELELI